MNGLRAYVEQQARKLRGPVSIAFGLAKRGIIPNIDQALRRVNELYPRPDISALLAIGFAPKPDS